MQLLNGTREDPLNEVLLKMNLRSTEQGMFGHQGLFRSGEVLGVRGGSGQAWFWGKQDIIGYINVNCCFRTNIR